MQLALVLMHNSSHAGVDMKRVFLAAVTLFLAFAFTSQAHAFGFPHANQPGKYQPLFITPAIKATGWAGNTLMFGEEKARIKATEITQRPNRFLHFYGNTVRFFHYVNIAEQNGGQW